MSWGNIWGWRSSHSRDSLQDFLVLQGLRLSLCGHFPLRYSQLWVGSRPSVASPLERQNLQHSMDSVGFSGGFSRVAAGCRRARTCSDESTTRRLRPETSQNAIPQAGSYGSLNLCPCSACVLWPGRSSKPPYWGLCPSCTTRCYFLRHLGPQSPSLKPT